MAISLYTLTRSFRPLKVQSLLLFRAPTTRVFLQLFLGLVISRGQRKAKRWRSSVVHTLGFLEYADLLAKLIDCLILMGGIVLNEIIIVID